MVLDFSMSYAQAIDTIRELPQGADEILCGNFQRKILTPSGQYLTRPHWNRTAITLRHWPQYKRT